MGLQIGLGLALGHTIIGTPPATVTDSSPVVLSASADLVITSPEALHPSDLGSIITSKTNLIGSIGDIGMTESGGAGTGLTGWTDYLSGSSRNWAQAGASNTRPSIRSDGPGGRQCFRTDGSLSWLPNAYDPAAPGTTNFFLSCIIRITTAGAGGQIFCGSTTNRFSIRSLAGPAIDAGNSVQATPTIGLTLNTWYLVDFLLSNSTGDYLKANGATTPSTPTNLGNIDVASLAFGARSSGGAGFGAVDVAGAWIYNGAPTNTEKTNRNAWLQKWYKGALVLPPN